MNDFKSLAAAYSKLKREHNEMRNNIEPKERELKNAKTLLEIRLKNLE